ncbi:MAG: MATE family efflux transporter [Peptostreptococcaceae bacterium]|jgi:putative MATE family efflux protein|nr:MATE family efflux transporter [Peptostreptococcaceae bacterium]
MQKSNLDLMVEEKPIKLLLKLGIPSVVMALFNEINSMVDTIFAGNFIADEAVSSMAIVFPFFILVSALAFLFSEGASIAIGRYLGAKNIDKANEIFNSTMFISCIISVIIACIGYFLFPYIVEFSKADSITLFYAKTYLRYLSIGIPIITTSIIMGKIVYIEGNTKTLLKSTVIQILFNIILNYIALAILKIGIVGTVLATIISFFIQGIYLYRFMTSGKMVLKLDKSKFKVTKEYFKEVIPLGLATFITMSLLSFTFGLESKIISSFGSSALAVQTITANIFSATGSIASGLMSASLVLMSYSVGAKDKQRFIEVLKLSLIIIFSATLLLNLPLVMDYKSVVSIFTDSKDIINIAKIPAYVYGMSAPLIFTTNTILYAMQPINMEKTATTMFSLQQIILFIPLLFILKPHGFNYAISAQPMAETIGAIITIFLIPLFIKKLNLTFDKNL